MRVACGILSILCVIAIATAISVAEVRADAEPLSVSAAELLPLRAQAARFEIVAGENKGDHVEVKVRPEGDEHWRVDQGALKNRRVRRDADGAVLMPQSDVASDDSTLVFTPSAELLPARLVKGRPARSKGEVRITNLKGDDEKASGDYVRVVELTGSRRIDTPAGRFDTLVVRADELFKLGLAKVQVVTVTDYAAGVGIVRQRVDTKVTKLGLFTSTESYTLLLDEAWSPIE